MQRNGDEQQKWLLFGSAAVLRLFLAAAFPTLPDFLTGRVEISTPVTSFKRCKCFIVSAKSLVSHVLTFGKVQEGLFLHNNGLSPYDGGVFHQVWRQVMSCFGMRT